MTSVTVISAVIARIQHSLKPADVTPKITPSWRNDAEKLLPGLQCLKSSLENADQGKKQRNKFVDFEKEIVQLCYDIDDSLAELEMSLITAKSGGIFSSGTNLLPQKISELISKSSDLRSLGSKLSEIAESLEKETGNVQSTKKQGTLAFLKVLQRRKSISVVQGPGTSSSNPDANENNNAEISPAGKEENNSPVPDLETGEDLAGMEDEVSKVLQNKEKLPVVCIWGKSGMGKTTFAKNVFYNLKVREHFESFAWVSIKQDFQMKKVLQDILLQLLPESMAENIMGMDEFKLTQEIFNVHDKKSYLVVLEDVRTVEDWRSIRVAFPTVDQSKSKILITTSLEEVAGVATSQGGGAYKMNRLTETECFNMLRDKAEFGHEEWENVGKTIFSLSGGARLPAIILGKSLTTMDLEARNQLLNDSGEIQGDERKVLRLSYEVLSHELRPCLLYMGQFPEGREIEIEKLYYLLSAEDLIIPPEGSAAASASASAGRKATLMKILDKLELKSLVQVQDVSSKRKFKTCRLHDQIRDFCIFQGLDEDFFEIVECKSAAGKFKGTTRRLAIYLNKYGDEKNTPFSIDDTMAEKIRSLLIFDTYESDQKSTWPSAINDFKEFIHLRVLDFNGIHFRVRKLPKGIDKLVLLKYLSFRGCWLEDLPPYISKLLCLETLDLRTNSKITIPDVLHTMKRLRHLYFPLEYESHDGKSKLQLNGLENLEILVNLDTFVCKVKDLSKLKNLLILTTLTHGRYEDLKDVIECLKENKAHLQYSSVTVKNFDCYTKERQAIFNNLLECESLHYLNVEGQIDKLSKDVSISPSLTEMVFDGSELSNGDPMDVLGKHEKLKSLVLTNDAFIGKEISFSAESKFPNLKILKLLNLSYLKEVTIDKGAMPELCTLVIQNCGDLKKVMMPKALNNRLLLAQGNKGDDVFSVEPTPTIIQEN